MKTPDSTEDLEARLSELQQAYDDLKAKHEELLTDYITVSAMASSLKREAARQSARRWALINPYG